MNGETRPLESPPVAIARTSTPAEAEPRSPDAIAIGDASDTFVREISPPTTSAPVRTGPRLLTPFSELKPPYPASKLASEEEARLTLRLTIDAGGRVIGVDPVGSADREFLDAARRYILVHWRYDPASEDSRPVASTTVITLTFQLDG